MALGSPVIRMFILSLSVICIFRAGDCSKQVHTSWFSYWQQKFPNIQPPEAFVRLGSPLTDAKTKEFLKYFNDGSLTTRSTQFCEAANLLCAEKAAAYDPRVCIPDYFYMYGTQKCKAELQGSATKEISSKTFFTTSSLRNGNQVTFPSLINPVNNRAFLPLSLATALPFSEDQLSKSLALFNVPDQSNMATNMKDTLRFCASSPSKGEILQCHTSIESMVDFVVQHLGTGVTLLTTDHANAQERKATVENVRILSPEGRQTVTCHEAMYPNLVYGCHAMSTSAVVDVTLKEEESKQLFHGLAVCHMDTTSWNALHPAFHILNTEPGAIPICHWVPQNNFVWVSSTN